MEYKSIVKPGLFCFATTVQTIGAGATLTPAINIANNADFILTEIRATIYKVAALTGDVLMQIQLGSGDLFSNVGVDICSFATFIGAGFTEENYPVKVPDVRIPANSELNVALTNNNTETLDVQIQLWGVKVSPANY